MESPELNAPEKSNEVQVAPICVIRPRIRRTRKPNHKSRVERTVKFTKDWAWRATASWLWVHLLAHPFQNKGRFFYPERVLIAGISDGLTRIGFSPSGHAYFPTIAKIGWLALITGFSVSNALFYVTVYLPFFPLTFIMFVFFGPKIRAAMKGAVAKQGLGRTSRKRDLTIASVFFLVTWLLLLSGSTHKLPEILGCIVAGLFLWDRSYAAFSFAASVEDVSIGYVRLIGEIQENFKKKAPSDHSKDTREVLWMQLRCEQFIYYFLLRGMLVLRGTRGRNRAAMLVLIEYVVNLLILGIANVMFWTTLVRLYSPDSSADLGVAVMFTAARILPGFVPPNTIHIPIWLDASTSLSAWLLFVVYAGPAASVFPVVQNSYVSAATRGYLILRRAADGLRRHIIDVECRRDALPEKSSAPSTADAKEPPVEGSARHDS